MTNPEGHSIGQRFERAVGWVESSSKFLFDARGGMMETSLHPDYALLRLELGIHLLPNGDWLYTEKAIEQLIALNEISEGARDLARDLVAHHLIVNRLMPKPLRTFAALLVLGRLKSPPKSRRKFSWLRNCAIVALARRVKVDFDLEMTSGDDKKGPKLSAADAVVQGLRKNGYFTTTTAVRKLLTTSEHEALRNEANTLTYYAKQLSEKDPSLAAKLFTMNGNENTPDMT